jgi:hypothetical protein
MRKAENPEPKIMLLINKKGYLDTVGLISSTYEQEQEILEVYKKSQIEIARFKEKLHERIAVN